MCGIAGMASQGNDRRFVPATERMVAALAHRGPDSHGVQDLGQCVLGNTRLAIVDTSDRGRQPMSNEDGTIWIVYNGECYNAGELRPFLLSRKHDFRSKTDTEVILHLYEEFGEDCVKKLRGMFAFAIWDSRANKLVLGRDRLGIKPLYYSELSDCIIFASEIKALLASELIPRRLDAAGVRAYLQFGHISPPWTAIQGVKPLDPGNVGVWQGGKWRTSRYWSLPAPANGFSHEDPEKIASNLRDILIASGRQQLMSDVPIALFLSGGIDSAVLGSLMKSAGAGQLTALTIGFEEKEFDESEPSKRTAELLGIPHQVIRLEASQTTESLDHALWAMDQPTMDGLNAYWISRAAAEAGFKVALSGQGGDELFGGYKSLAWFDRFSHVATCLKRFPRAAGRVVFDHSALPFRWRKLSYLVGADDPFVAAQLAVRLSFLEGDVRGLVNPALAAVNSRSEACEFLTRWAQESVGQDLPERIAFLDFPAHLEPRLLRDGDAMSMAHSLEVRPVLLDHEIVDFVMRLPLSLRLRNKQLLLAAIREQMPPLLRSELLARPKRTFTFPFSRWIAQGMRPAIEEVLQPKRIESTGVLNPSSVGRLWRRYLARPEAVGWSRIWSVFVLARWCEIMQVSA
jgi:asparagine synthase (glutamine-hydrolysing)